jgi:purine-binding chemotaxis protein CheW
VGEASGKTGQYVLFRLGTEEYGLPIEQVSSIIRFEQATPVPRAPDAVDGIINLRGHVIPIVNLKRRLLGQGFEPSSTSRIVVAEGEAGMVGLVVDAANEVATISLDEVRPAPEGTLTPETAEAFEGVASHEGHLVILLNLDKALPGSDYERVSEEAEPDV